MKEQYLIHTKNIVAKGEIDHHEQFLAPMAESLLSFFRGELSVVYACVRKRFALKDFSSLTTWSIWMKLHRKHPLNVLFYFFSKFKKSSPTKFFSRILKKCSLGEPLSDSFKPY